MKVLTELVVRMATIYLVLGTRLFSVAHYYCLKITSPNWYLLVRCILDKGWVSGELSRGLHQYLTIYVHLIIKNFIFATIKNPNPKWITYLFVCVAVYRML